MVECLPSKQNVVGSNPVIRSMNESSILCIVLEQNER